MNKKTWICGVLAVSMIIPTWDVQAALPTVSIDEAVYVNLDYYGATSDISVVKSCNLNKIRTFTDYGPYRSVTNMSNLALPVISEEGVKWDLSGMELSEEKNPERFYYECKLRDNNSIVLPWHFDVSYKLNGVPKKADELAGAAGLVEINIHAIPNKDANPYYKNNMLLQVAAMVNMDDTLSVDAPGAQLQSLGTYKAVMFAGLPGEDISFTLRLGTNSFENKGITMMMIPGTLSQIQDIKDLKESKDKVQDAANAVKASMDDIISTMESMSNGMKATQKGLGELDEGRSTISGYKGEVYEASDKAITDLTNLTDNLNSLIPHMQKGQKFVIDVNEKLDDIVDTVNSTKTDLEEYKKTISTIQEEVRVLQDNLEKADGHKDRRKRAFEDLSKSLGRLDSSSRALKTDSSNLSSGMKGLGKSTKDMNGAMKTLTGNKAFKTLIQTELEGQISPEDLPAMMKGINDVGVAAGNTLDKTSTVSNQTSELLDSMSGTISEGDDMLRAMQRLVDLGDIYIRIMEDGYDNTQSLLTQTNRIGEITKSMLKTTDVIIDQTTEMNGILNDYEGDVLGLLQDSEDMTEQMKRSLFSTLGFLTSFQAMMRYSGKSLDAGTQKTLNGMIEILQKSLIGITKTSNIKNANQLIKDTIDKELNRFEEETNVLNMDMDQPKISFTSDKNVEPESIQIILRTDEISLDDDEELEDLEPKKVKEGVGKRLKKVFLKIWRGITTMFHKD